MEGMVAWTENDKVKTARKTTLEFLLTNHPLDCPVCDKGGECEFARHGVQVRRWRIALSSKKSCTCRKQQWSPVVYYDAPRCILCYRCIRVCNERHGRRRTGTGISRRNSEIIPNKGRSSGCEECGNCIDVCPVGALTAGLSI